MVEKHLLNITILDVNNVPEKIYRLELQDFAKSKMDPLYKPT